MTTESSTSPIKRVRKNNDDRFVMVSARADAQPCAHSMNVMHTLKLPRTRSSASSQLVCVQRFTLCFALTKDRFGSLLVGLYEIISHQLRFWIPSGVQEQIRVSARYTPVQSCKQTAQ